MALGESGLSADEENEEEALLPPTQGIIPLPDGLARTVAKAYSEILKEPVPDRLSELMDAIRRFEESQRKGD